MSKQGSNTASGFLVMRTTGESLPALPTSTLMACENASRQASHTSLTSERLTPWCQRIAKGASGKGRRAKNVKNRQKSSKSFSTLFGNFQKRQKSSKIVKNRQKVFRHFSTIFKNVKKRQKASKIVKKRQNSDTCRQFSRKTIFPAPLLGGSDGANFLVAERAFPATRVTIGVAQGLPGVCRRNDTGIGKDPNFIHPDLPTPENIPF